MANWKKQLSETLPLLGHRNWIVVVDAAYPAQCRGGIDTLVTGEGQLEVVKAVLSAVDKASHVQPVIFVDAELDHVPLEHAKGIQTYRMKVARLLGNRAVSRMPHEDIIRMLDAAGETFRVLVLKTTMTLPYTSVFVRLDCGYWTEEAEKALRDRMGTMP
jgi:D-ribose pyranose/furanose isomerase RbsD